MVGMAGLEPTWNLIRQLRRLLPYPLGDIPKILYHSQLFTAIEIIQKIQTTLNTLRTLNVLFCIAKKTLNRFSIAAKIAQPDIKLIFSLSFCVLVRLEGLEPSYIRVETGCVIPYATAPRLNFSFMFASIHASQCM